MVRYLQVPNRCQDTGEEPFHITGSPPKYAAIDHLRLNRFRPIVWIWNRVRMANQHQLDSVPVSALFGNRDQLHFLDPITLRLRDNSELPLARFPPTPRIVNP